MSTPDHQPGTSTPPIHRGSMVAQPWRGFTRSVVDLMLGRRRNASPGNTQPPAAWERAATNRRRALLALVALSAAGATALLDNVLPAQEAVWLRTLQIGLYALLVAWVSAGFFTAMMGFWVLWRGDPHAMSAARAGHAPIDANARTAIVMPICNEDVPRVFAGLRATYESLAQTGALDRFDFFVLSDTGNADTRVAELDAWLALCRAVDGFGRIFYRWRQHR
ncbi:MAG TPA: glucan biosynthesis glucosyltransferase H, partial [Rhizobacter sp.]|nr:glucan biosynthesis glucosyltransferase H [Rhizobacter sp.]